MSQPKRASFTQAEITSFLLTHDLAALVAIVEARTLPLHEVLVCIYKNYQNIDPAIRLWAADKQAAPKTTPVGGETRVYSAVKDRLMVKTSDDPNIIRWLTEYRDDGSMVITPVRNPEVVAQ